MARTLSEREPVLAGSDVVVASHALVRVSALPYWPATEAMQTFRDLLDALTACELRLARLVPELEQQLYRSRPGHSERFHRQVVLPLRRNIHNGRTVSRALQDAAAVLHPRVPALPAWLAAVEDRDRLRRELAGHAGPALADERAAMAAVCASEPLRRAAASSGADLLYGLERAAAAGAAPGARVRKAEPKILRQALRATTKTSPRSWYTAVGWGVWDHGDRTLGRLDRRAVTRPDQGLLSWVLWALLARPDVRWQVPHRSAPGLTLEPGHVTFRRDRPAVSARYIGSIEQRVRLPRTATLDVVVARLRAAGTGGVRLGSLLTEVTGRLPGGEDAAAAVTGYLDRLADEQLLVPSAPVDPQALDPLPALADWADRAGCPEEAAILRSVGRESRAYAGVAARDRHAADERLERLWARLSSLVGAPPLGRPVSPVKEDVVLRGRFALGRAFGSDVRHDLARLAPLTELFDGAVVLRALLRRRLLDAGGRCRLIDVVPEAAQLWAAAGRVGADGTVSPGEQPLPPELTDLAALRAEVTAAVRAGAVRDGEVEIPDPVLAEVAAALPAWLRCRSASHAYFVQPAGRALPDPRKAVQWCVNQVGDGWGRYSSRFLHWLDPELAERITRSTRAALGDRRIVQYRPVVESNVNVHPLLFADEVGEDPAWAGLRPDDLDLVHDPRTGAVHLRVRGTGEAINVLYLGFVLAPVLPDRAIPLYLDLGTSLATFGHLAPVEPLRFAGRPVRRRPRLRYRGLVLARRSWTLETETVAEWETELRAEGDVPVHAVARWSAGLGLPGTAFLRSADRPPFGTDPEVLRKYLTATKPHFADLRSALHLRCLRAWLSRHEGPARIEEALPEPGSGPGDGRAVELIVETYRRSG
ncbi:lantibiotic dehydratase [Amycolatopsis sp. NPDC004747]